MRNAPPLSDICTYTETDHHHFAGPSLAHAYLVYWLVRGWRRAFAYAAPAPPRWLPQQRRVYTPSI